MSQTSTGTSNRQYVKYWLIVAASLVIALAVSISICSRFQEIWKLTRLERLSVILACTLLLVYPTFYIFKQTLHQFFKTVGNSKYFILAAGIFIGVLAQATGFIRPSLPPVTHRLEIEIKSEGSQDASPIRIHEIRYADGSIIEPNEFQVEGNWQMSGFYGFQIPGGQSGRLTAVFSASPDQNLTVVVEERKENGEIILRADDTEKVVDLRGRFGIQRQVQLPLGNENQLWKMILVASDIITLAIASPIFILLVILLGIKSRSTAHQLSSTNSYLYSSIFLAVFIGLLFLPLQGFPGSLSEFEKDFWGHKELYLAYSTLRQHLLGDRYYGKVILSGDNWLIWSSPSSMDDYQNAKPFSQSDLVEIQDSLDHTYETLQAKDIDFLVVVVPNKNTIYPEKIPDQIQIIGSQSRLDQVLTYQKINGKAPILDLRPALIEAKKQDPVYYSTDTHWNPAGALAGSSAIAQVLKDKFLPFQPYTILDYEKFHSLPRPGDMASNSLPSVQPDETYELIPKFDRRVERFILSDKMPWIIMFSNSDATLPRAVVYHDSFGIWLQEHLANYFSKVTFIWSHKIDTSFAAAEQADIVILEITERSLYTLLKNPPPEED